MTTEFKSPVDALLPAIMEAAAEWEKANTPESIKSRVKSLLDKRQMEMFMALAGFEQSFGTWQIKADQKDSPAYNLIREAMQEATKEFLAEMPKMPITPRIKKQVQSELTAEFRYLISQEVKRQAKVFLKEEADELIQEMLKSVLLEKVIKTKKLINA